jgi:glycosyltransferase involved in cell wall biosynthesis
MRILHLTTFLQGGAGRAITELALAQAAAGHDVAVAIDEHHEPGYESYAEYVARLESGGVRLHRIHSTFKRDLAKNLVAVRTLRSLPEITAVDLVHAHAAVPSFIGRLATAKSARPVPIVQTMHGWGVQKTDDQVASDIVLLNLADRVVVPSNTSHALLRTLGVSPDLISIVPYGLPDETELPLRRDATASLLQDLGRRWNLTVGSVGTIGTRKNQRLIVDALAQVRGAIVGCVFIGDGDVAGLAEYARTRGVSDRTVVLGYQPDASQYLRRTDACVLASRSEGQPLTVLEAFRDGVPVIAADIDELREMIVHRETGWLFRQGDPRALAAALENAARNGLRGIAAKARVQYETQYTVAQMVAGYADVYRQAIDGMNASSELRWRA